MDKKYRFHVEKLNGEELPDSYYIIAKDQKEAYNKMCNKFPGYIINGGEEVKPSDKINPLSLYVLTIHQVSDCEDLGIQTRIFTHREKAIAALKEWRDDEIKNAEKRGFDIYRDTPTQFEVYENGRYCENHSIATIEMLDTE